MTLIAVSIAVDHSIDVPEALERAERAAVDGAVLVEWRLDRLVEEPDAVRAAARLLGESPLPSIVTCRPSWEGGDYAGGDDDRVSFFETIGTGASPPRYIDIELAAYRRSSNLRQKVDLVVDHPGQVRQVSTRLMLSSHDFEGRPASLTRDVEAMADAPACAVIKAVWMARSLRDNFEVFDLLRHRPKPMVAHCMGEFGVMSRVLAPKFGGFLTFATDGVGTSTAPGQVTVRDLTHLYRVRRVGRATRVYGVMGWPVAQSKGPLVHNAAFDDHAIDGVYVPMPVAPGWEPFKATLGAALDAASLDLRGVSVTSPHKEHLLRFVREEGGTIDPEAERIGAANTLVIGDDGSLSAMNTDAPAALETLLSEGRLDRDAFRRQRVAVLGSGGAARAVTRAISAAGAAVTIVSRDQARAEAVAATLDGLPDDAGGRAAVQAASRDSLRRGSYDIFVNCTPLGMEGGPGREAAPLDHDVTIDDTTTVFETIYNPAVTPLIAMARRRGAQTVGGRGMFLRQAALQFAAWTSIDPTAALMSMTAAMDAAMLPDGT